MACNTLQTYLTLISFHALRPVIAQVATGHDDVDTTEPQTGCNLKQSNRNYLIIIKYT